MAQLGTVREYAPGRVVLDVSEKKVKTTAMTLLKDYPVDDILIDEVPVEEVIRKIFIASHA
jgi:ABC-type uncharacterized transport system ATPase subunit